ncbi:MAG: hypothetical protein HC818_01600 [Synechococcaceae cyanobacterium RM1_1_27]|nr:hypothetical protein [Synechococcaceae cyanobacterium RM1_1_27]
MASSPFFSSPFLSAKNTIGENAIGEQGSVDINRQNGSQPLVRLNKDRETSLSDIDQVSLELEPGDLKQRENNDSYPDGGFELINGSPHGMMSTDLGGSEGIRAACL